MATSIAESLETTILERVIAPETPDLPVAAAREILKWSFSDADHERMSELAAKARAGTLNPDESAETAAFERVSSLLGFLKSKARRSLAAAQAK